MRTIETLICQGCGKQYDVERRKAAISRYCSRPCMNLAATSNHRRACEVCQKEFKPRRRGQQTCSIACRDTDRAARTLPRHERSSQLGTERAEWIDVECQACGKALRRRKTDVRKSVYCSRECYRSQPFRGSTGRPQTVGTGERRIDKNGYAWVYLGRGVEGAYASGYALEHRYVMSGIIGRPLEPNENPHHRNGVKSDNQPGNLELWVVHQPKGQRVQDLVAWARKILEAYEPILDRLPVPA